jgi:hypothetical protein
MVVEDGRVASAAQALLGRGSLMRESDMGLIPADAQPRNRHNSENVKIVRFYRRRPQQGDAVH